MLKHWFFEGVFRWPESTENTPFKIIITKARQVRGTGCQKKLHEFDFTEFNVAVHSWPIYELNALPSHGATAEEAQKDALVLVADLLTMWKIVIMDNTGKPAKLKDLKMELF